MSLDQLIQATLPPKLEESKPVSPTLLVGLGGTGKEVLLRFRRLIVERYGALSALPFIQYIQLDTDSTATAREQYDRKGSDDPLDAEVRFSPAERIDLTIEGGTGKYIDHINAYPHIKRWFPTSGKIVGLGNLGDGAGQIRMASRLGFFHAPNFTKISAQLDRCKGLLKDASILQRSAGLGFDFDAQGMNVYVIASLAGGTGGGTFLDMGFLLQRFFPSAERVGIFLLPTFFTDYAGGERVRANGYAALMELNHYSFGHPFQVDWDGGEEQVLQPPPYSNTYLIDGENEAGLTIGSSGKEYDAYQMVSEALFQDYSIGKFSGMKRATRINLVNFNLNVYTHNFLKAALPTENQGANRGIVGDTYPTRFGSFGLSTLAFPSERIHNASACRLAIQILDHWQKSLVENVQEKLFFTLLDHDDVRFVQGRYERRDGGGVLDRKDVEEALLAYDAESGKTFPAYFWQKAQTIRTEIEAAPKGQKASLLAAHRAQLDQFLAKEDSEIPEEWGPGIRQIETNTRMYVERVKAGIEKRSGELANNPSYGVAYTLSLLRELKALLLNESFYYQTYFEEQLGLWVEEVQSYSFETDQLQAEITRHERQILFRTEDLKRDMEKLVGDEKSAEPGALYGYLFSRVMKQVVKRGRRVCEEIDQFLGKDDPTGKGIIGRYYTLLAGFERLKDRLRNKERYFSAPPRSELTISLYRHGDLEEWYRKWVGEAEAANGVVRVVGNQLLQSVFRVDSVTAALDHIRKTPAAEIEERMVSHCKQYFTSRSEQPEALSLLFETGRLDPKQREEMIRRAFNLAKIWLKRSERGLEHTGLGTVKADQRPCLIGVDTNNLALLHQFEELIRNIQAPGDSPSSILNIGSNNKGMIVFYNELAGVPAFYPGSVTSPNGLRKSYSQYKEKDELHIDKNRFQFNDLIPKTDKEAHRYADSLKAFVLARLLGILRVREIRDDSEHPTFQYSYKREASAGLVVDEVWLGDELHAVDYLYRDESRAEHLTDRQVLIRQSEEIIRTLRNRHLLWVYGLLLEFYQRKVHPPVVNRTSGIADLTIVQYSPEFAVLSLVRSQMRQLVASEDEWKKLTVALEARRGKPLAEELTYEEFAAALGPYCKPAGQILERAPGAVAAENMTPRDVLALDMSKIEGSRADKPRPPARPVAATPVEPVERVVERPCPSCGEPIDARALFCRHCRRTVAEHVTCDHCGETRVPGDLEHCWRCGNRMRKEERIECPQCFDFRGYASEFPCPVCGYDPKGGGGPGIETAEPSDTAASSNGDRPAGVPASAPFGPQQVECPTCYSMVEPGPRCSICQGLLGAN